MIDMGFGFHQDWDSVAHAEISHKHWEEILKCPFWDASGISRVSSGWILKAVRIELLNFTCTGELRFPERGSIVGARVLLPSKKLLCTDLRILHQMANGVFYVILQNKKIGCLILHQTSCATRFLLVLLTPILLATLENGCRRFVWFRWSGNAQLSSL